MRRLLGIFVSFVLFCVPSLAHAFNLASEGYSGFYINPTYHIADSKVKLGQAAWQRVGLPVLGFHYATLGGKDFNDGGLGDGDLLWFNVTEGLFDRLEVGYSYLVFNHDTGWVMTPSLDKNFHIFHTKLALIKEGEWASWMPGLSFGFIYRTIDNGGRRLNGPKLGLEGYPNVKDSGSDYYFQVGKTLTFLPWPTIVSAGMRSTTAELNGLLGFGNEREEVFEGSIAVVPLVYRGKQLIVGYEHKQQPKYDDWFSVFAALVWNEHLTLSVGFADLGNAKPLKGLGVNNGLNVHHQAVMGITYQF